MKTLSIDKPRLFCYGGKLHIFVVYFIKVHLMVHKQLYTMNIHQHKRGVHICIAFSASTHQTRKMVI